MSETKWTPGPWHIQHEYNVYGSNDRLAANTGGSSDGRVRDGGVAENKANARLIAAAPDLYAALLDALFCMDGIADGDFARNGDTVKAAMATARAALNKARGA